MQDVARQLRPWLHVLDAASLWQIVVDDTRTHVRAAALQLVFATGKWRSLPWLVRVSAHSDQQTAELARRLVESWFSTPRCNRIFTKPSESEAADLATSIQESRLHLDSAFLRQLEEWLAD